MKEIQRAKEEITLKLNQEMEAKLNSKDADHELTKEKLQAAQKLIDTKNVDLEKQAEEMKKKLAEAIQQQIKAVREAKLESQI